MILKLSMLKHLKSKSEFTKNVVKLFSGFAVVNIISFAILPILTRLYSTEDFGNFQLLTSIIITFSVISSLKYEMAIVLPKDECESNHIVVVSLLALLVTTGIYSILFFCCITFLLDILNAKELESYSYLILVGIFFAGLIQVLNYTLIREKYFGALSKNRIYQTFLTQGSSICLGLLNPSFFGLFISQIVGNILAVFLVFKKNILDFKSIDFEKLKFYAFKYKKFPLVNTLSVFINTLSVQLPVFMFAKYYGPEVIGFYMLAKTLLSKPLDLIGRSVSHVYFQAASEAFHKSTNDLFAIYKGTVKKLMLIGILPAIIVITSAPFLVGFIFGREWAESGNYMQIIMFWEYCNFVNFPISTTFTIINKQEVALILRIISIFVRFFSMYYFRNNPIDMLCALSISAGMYYIAFNLLVYRNIKALKA